jgi:hypothetical protein
MYFHIFQLIHHELDTKTYRSVKFIYLTIITKKRREKNEFYSQKTSTTSDFINSFELYTIRIELVTPTIICRLYQGLVSLK